MVVYSTVQEKLKQIIEKIKAKFGGKLPKVPVDELNEIEGKLLASEPRQWIPSEQPESEKLTPSETAEFSEEKITQLTELIKKLSGKGADHRLVHEKLSGQRPMKSEETKEELNAWAGQLEQEIDEIILGLEVMIEQNDNITVVEVPLKGND